MALALSTPSTSSVKMDTQAKLHGSKDQRSEFQAPSVRLQEHIYSGTATIVSWKNSLQKRTPLQTGEG